MTQVLQVHPGPSFWGVPPVEAGSGVVEIEETASADAYLKFTLP